MKIQAVKIRNFMGISEARLQLDGLGATLGGKNGAGKTSILHAIWTATLGRPAQPARPVHGNALTASIRIELDDGYNIIKEFDSEKGKWKTTIYDDEECRLPRAQEFLDELVGSIPIDPHAFINMDAKKQGEALLKIVGGELDLDSFNEARLRAFNKRTDVARSVKTLTAQIEGYRSEDIDEDREREDASELIRQISEIEQHNRGIEDAARTRHTAHQQKLTDARRDYDQAQHDIRMKDTRLDTIRSNVSALKAQLRNLEQNQPPESDERCQACPLGGDVIKNIERLQKDIDSKIEEGKKLAAEIKADKSKLESPEALKARLDTIEAETTNDTQEQPKDASGLQQRLQEAEENNRIVQKAEDREKARAELKNKEAEVEKLNESIADIDLEKQNALEGAKMPIEGLSFDLENGGLLFDGVPYKQIAHSEQMAVAFSLLVAQKPRLELITITDASLLDSATRAALHKSAVLRGFQVIAEEVADEPRPEIFYIEKGTVAAAAERTAA